MEGTAVPRPAVSWNPCFLTSQGAPLRQPAPVLQGDRASMLQVMEQKRKQDPKLGALIYKTHSRENEIKSLINVNGGIQLLIDIKA